MDLHDQIKIPYRDGYINVDGKIAPLLAKLWKLGIDTYMSCECDSDNYVWIMFPNCGAHESFMNTVFIGIRSESGTLARGVGCKIPGTWKHDVKASSTSNSGFISGINLMPSVRFPIADIAFVEARLNNVLKWCSNVKV